MERLFKSFREIELCCKGKLSFGAYFINEVRLQSSKMCLKAWEMIKPRPMAADKIGDILFCNALFFSVKEPIFDAIKPLSLHVEPRNKKGRDFRAKISRLKEVKFDMEIRLPIKMERIASFYRIWMDRNKRLHFFIGQREDLSDFV